MTAFELGFGMDPKQNSSMMSCQSPQIPLRSFSEKFKSTGLIASLESSNEGCEKEEDQLGEEWINQLSEANPNRKSLLRRLAPPIFLHEIITPIRNTSPNGYNQRSTPLTLTAIVWWY